MEKQLQALIDKLSPLERTIVPHLGSSVAELKKKTGLDKTSLVRGLQFLANKNALHLETKKETIIDLGTNGIYYKKNHLPERTLLITLGKTNHLSFTDAQKQSKLSDNEFKVAIGILKDKALVELKNGKLSLRATKEELTKKTFEEHLLELLPLDETALQPEQKLAFLNLKKRKDIIEIKEKTQITYTLTDIGKALAGSNVESDLIEEVTPDVIKNWKRGKKFRAYDLHAPVPKIYGGKRHFVNEAITRGKRIWLDMGFTEMTGTKTQTGFWNFDALFTAQDHPVRELHDTFFIKDKIGKLPSQALVKKVKQSHESGVVGSKGWQYSWNENDAKKVVLRTHTTALSAQTLAALKKENLPAKFFAIGRNFRNETLDWSHGFEFNQTEGIVIDKNANFRQLIWYLKTFAEKMGFATFRIQPAYFPYTEPSVEGAVWHEGKKTWVEVIAAGIFRPEVTEPLLGEPIPVLAWGPGFDRLMILAQGINDLRDVYKNDLKDLREKKII